MYGVVIGDLAGSIHEKSQFDNGRFGIGLEDILCSKLIHDESFYSDDTILTMAVLEAILNEKNSGHDINYEFYLRKYISEYRNYKPLTSFPHFEKPFSPGLLDWYDGKRKGNSRGNGAMMRVAPVGYLFDNEKDVRKNAFLATVPSHNSEEAIEAATTIALIIFYLRRGYTKTEVFKKLNMKRLNYEPFSQFNTTCSETMGNLLYMLENSSNFEGAMRKTLLMGGDTDTNCAILGGMAEAAYGVPPELVAQTNERIPENFQKLLERGYNV